MCTLNRKDIDMEASILDLRKHMNKVLAALDMNETVKLTYRGKEKATIVPTSKHQNIDLTNNEAFGLWSDRFNTGDVDKLARNIRKGRVDAI
jgi:antitoxin (DNA-binding transcriptional repressor) of toxin-antitoxin stability system